MNTPLSYGVRDLRTGTRVRVKSSAPREDKRVLGKTGTFDQYRTAEQDGEIVTYAQLRLDVPIRGMSFWLAHHDSIELVDET